MTGYAIVDIPGWESFSMNSADRDAVDARLQELAHGTVPEDVPRDTATPFRSEVYRHLSRLMDQARTAGAGLVCIPTGRSGDTVIPASYTVSEWTDPDHETADPVAILKVLASQSVGEASIVDLDGQPGLREEDIEPPRPGEEPLALYAGRRVTYTVSSPVDPRAWVVFVFATIGSGDPAGPLADILVEVFDAHLSTLRWDD